MTWTITSAYTEHDTGDPDCPNYRVAATVKGPEQREPVEVVPAEQLQGAVETERADIVTLLQEIADAEPRMSEARIAILAAAKRIHQRGQ